MTRVFHEYRARERFERNLERLELELAMGSPRRHLDVLVELLELLVEETGGTLLTNAYRKQLAAVKEKTETRTHLRLVK